MDLIGLVMVIIVIILAGLAVRRQMRRRQKADALINQKPDAPINQGLKRKYRGLDVARSENPGTIFTHQAHISSAGIFISYRWDDEPHLAGRLNDRITNRFGRDQVFIDVDSIEPGLDFAEVIDGALAKCRVLLVLIGKNWIGAVDQAGRRRLDDPNDYVRLEVETALSRRIRVIPILVEGAVMPRVDQLPAGIESLVRRNAMEISHSRFNSDVDRVVEVLRRTMT